MASSSASQWQLIRSVQLPEMGPLHILEYKHKRLGTGFIHTQRPFNKEDRLRALAIAFKTPAQDDRGTPHILEHTTLCGSKEYPVRDPFFRMLGRSLAPYKNAWTSAAVTAYPFSTVNAVDYGNMRDVYWDAVFHPLLRPEDFAQEGWRLNKESQKIDGVVYNEMRGALSDPDNLCYKEILRAMLPGTPFAKEYGGDPLSIPHLTHEDLLRFHADHYHPANALIVTHGPDGPEEDLQYFADKLSHHEPNEKQPVEFDHEINWPDAQLSLTTTGPEAESRWISATAVGKACDLDEVFAGNVLSELLLSGPSAPLRQTLLESAQPLAKSFTCSGFSDETPWTCFIVGLQGVLQEHPPGDAVIQRHINHALQDVVDGKAPQERIDALLAETRLTLLHQRPDFGLDVVQKCVHAWGSRNISLGTFADLFDVGARMRAFGNGQLALQNVAKKILDSRRRLHLSILPDENFFGQKALAEAALLSQLLSQQKDVVEKKKPTIGEQEKDDDDILPTLTEADIPVQLTDPSLLVKTAPSGNRHFEVFRRAAPTTGLVYLKVMLDVPKEHAPLVPLWSHACTEIGTNTLTPAEFAEEIRRFTAGISVSPMLVPRPSANPEQPAQLKILLSCYALKENAQKALGLLRSAIYDAKWSDTERLDRIRARMAAQQEAAIADNGTWLASVRAEALLAANANNDGECGALKEALYGYSQLQWLKDGKTLFDLARLGSFMNSCRVDRVAVIAEDPDGLNNNLDPLASASSRNNGPIDLTADSSSASLPESIEHALDSSYVAVAWKLPTDLSAADLASFSLLAKILTARYLHKLVREEGGAYGANAHWDNQTCIFSMTSFRDPTPRRTLSIYTQIQKMLSWLRRELNSHDNHAKDDIINGSKKDNNPEIVLREARLRAFSVIDAPKSVSSAGLNEFYYGFEDDKRKAIRTAMLSVKPEYVIKAMEMLINSRYAHAIVGPKDFKASCQGMGYEPNNAI